MQQLLFDYIINYSFKYESELKTNWASGYYFLDLIIVEYLDQVFDRTLYAFKSGFEKQCPYFHIITIILLLKKYLDTLIFISACMLRRLLKNNEVNNYIKCVLINHFGQFLKRNGQLGSNLKCN